MSKQLRQSRRRRNARHLKQRSRRFLYAERLEDRTLLAADLGLHNENLPLDVNRDGGVTPNDALIVINYLNASHGQSASPVGSSDQVAEAEGSGNGKSPDVNDDGQVTSNDALRVINALNAEGESGPVMRVIARMFERPTNYPFEERLVDHDFNPGTPDTNALVRVHALDEITTIGVGQEFVVKILVEDVRNMSTREGVFSAYVDVNFDGALASLQPNVADVLHPQTVAPTPYLHSFDYFTLNGQMGVSDTYARAFGNNFGQRAEPASGDGMIDTDLNGVLDQLDFVGSFSGSLTGPGPGEFVLVEWVMTADNAGTLILDPEATTQPVADDPNDANESPLFDAGIFGQDAPVCPSQSTQDPCMGDIEFVADSITIVDRISAVDDGPINVTEGDPSITIDALGNDINNTSGTLTISDPLGTPTLGGTVVNNGSDITYTPAPNAFGIETFTYTISNGLGDFSSATVTVDIAPVNDGPINTIPGTQNIDEDNDLVFSGGLSVSDIDADAGSGLQVDLSVSSGSLTVGSSGATVTGDGTGTVRVNGTVADVNGALNGLTYSPNLNFNGSDALSVNTTDNGNFGSGGTLSDNDTVNITVNPINDAPINTVPGPQVLFNTDTLSFGTGALQVQDVDASNLEVTLTVGQGTVNLGSTTGLSVSGNNSPSLTASGSTTNLNSALSTLIYDPLDSFIGTDTLTMTTNDSGATGAGGPLSDVDTVSLTVTPPEVPFAASDLFQIEEDSSTTNLDILGNDLKPDPQQDNTLSITQINGQSVGSTGDQFSTGNNGTITFLGSSVSYLPEGDFFGTDTFTYTIVSTPDAGDGPSTGTVNIEVQPINDGPVNSVPGSLSIDEDNSLSFSGANLIDVADIDAGSGDVTVTLTVNGGTLNVSTGGGGNVSNNGTGQVSIDGTVSQVNSSLGGLTYSPNANFFGSDRLTVNTNDNGNTGGSPGDPTGSHPLSDNDTVDITVQPINDGPTIVVPGNQVFITDFDNTLSSVPMPLQIGDVDAGNDDVQFDLTIGDGALTVLDTSSLSSVSGNGTNSVSLQGSVTNVNSALLSGVTYRTSTDGNRTLAATVNDLGNNGGIPGDPNANNPLSASGNIAVEVLDFVPSNIGGFVFLDVNNDANKAAEETGIEGVRMTLTGTTLRNTPVSLQATTGPNGDYLFPDLEPGNYDLGQSQPANAKDGLESFASPGTSAGNDRATVSIPIAGGVDSRNNNFGERGLTTPFISLYDLLASTHQRSAVLLSNDETTAWSAFLGVGWEGFSSPSVDLLTMTFTVTNSTGNARAVNLAAHDPARPGRLYMDRFMTRQDGERQVIRLNGSAADFGFTSGDSEGEGEGDLADVQAANPGEMYAQAVDQLFGEMA